MNSYDFASTSNPTPRTTQWGLVILGNWAGNTGDPSNPGVKRTGDFDGDGYVDTTSYLVHHGVNAANQITGVSEYAQGDNPIPTQAMSSDSAGNLVSDGIYYFQYDAWNRLIQVNTIGTAALVVEGSSRGKIASGDLGDLVSRYTYDGLGRLIKKDNPVVTGLSGIGSGGSRPDTSYLQTKDYYYDGVRRIQEVISRPLPEMVEELPGPGGVVRNDELPMLRSGDPLPGGGGMDPNLPQAWAEQWVDREYVYGPAYVDEFVCQIDRDNNVIYMLQDANYNVVALVSGGWFGTGDQPVTASPPGTVLEQYTYEPYGTVIAAEAFAPHAVNRVGFQGLFFERYDGSFSDPTISPGVTGLYHARNRFYNPILGRFIQRDVNETALPIITALAMNGEAMSSLVGGFDAQGLYGDGMNLYQFAGSNPVNNRDPSGLSDDYDEILSDLNGQALATTGYIQNATGWMLIGIKASLNVASSLLGFDVFNSAKNIIQGGGTFWDYLDVGLTLAGPLAKAGKLAAKFGLSAGGKAFKWGREMLERGFKRCNCFIAGTLVETPDGPRVIESLQEGDEVFTRDQDCPTETPRPGRVTRVFRNLAPAILWLSLANGQVIGTTPGHEVWTQQNGWTFAGQLAIGDEFIDQEGQPVRITAIALEAQATTVYNLEVDGTFTYFANGVWVHNNSCDIASRRLMGRITNWAGHVFEAAVLEMQGLTKYVGPKLRGDGRNFIPDFLQDGIIGDVKSAEYVYMDDQLKAIAAYARENGLTPVLYVADRVSGEVASLFKVIPIGM